MSVQDVRAQTIALAMQPADVRRRQINTMAWSDVVDMEAEYERWAHESQLVPGGEGWRTWLLMAGRGFGKTRAGAEWVHAMATARPKVRIALVGATIADARTVMVEGVSGILSIAKGRRRRVRWEPSLGRLRWSNGSEAQIFSGDNADGLRGPEHDFAWCDELAKWGEADETWMNVRMGLRRGSRPRTLVTTTPRPMALLDRMMSEPLTVTTRGKTSDNLNLDAQVIELLTATYGGTRVGRQELDGELIRDVEGALWPWALIEQRRTEAAPPDAFDRIVVGVDPPAGASEDSDACGIVVCGSRGNELFVLEDASVRGLSPEGWSNRVAAAAARWHTSLVVAEANNGGAMVKSVLTAADSGLAVRIVHASVGKVARAEPVALKFEAGKAWFAGHFPKLEIELAAMQAGGGIQLGGRSPDRADAMVWAMTVLSETRSGVPRVRRL